MSDEEMKLEALERLCDAATPGPWTATNWGGYDPKDDHWFVDVSAGPDRDHLAAIDADLCDDGICLANKVRDKQEQNMKFIAAANPQTVKQLIELVQQCKETLAGYLDEPEGNHMAAKNMIDAIEAFEKGVE